MITEQSIQQVKDAVNIDEVVANYVELKKAGSGFVGCCPFHNESSPSFHVTPAKGMFKCFGCGEGGDAVSFLMKHQRMDYPTAIRQLAKQYNISIEETATNEEDKLVSEKKTTLYELNAAVARMYHQELKNILAYQPDHWVTKELHERRNFSPETIADLKLGYAPAGWNFLTQFYSQSEVLMDMKELGLAKESKGKTYDVFRDRLMFPFVDRMGRISGFTGRKNPDCKDKDIAKYFNSQESILFKKSKTFYGIYTAEREIRKAGYAVLVEGQADVAQMQQHGVLNTICASGTAFTEDHAQELRRLCDSALIITDGDNAGLKSALKTIDILIANDIQADVVRLPDDHDPDSFIRAEQERLELEALK